MTYQQKDTLVIVFGAGGRVGQALLPILAPGPWDVVGVARKEKPAVRPPNVHWIQVDVTDTQHWERSLRVFCGMADIYRQVIVVDLLLDRSTVSAMRRSLAAATAYVTRLRSRLEAVERPCSLVLASTTAVLAPWPYQTPYGRAKRSQLIAYRAAGYVGGAVLFPSLVDNHGYAKAAQLIERTVGLTRRGTPTRLELVATHDKNRIDPVANCHASTPLRRVANVAAVHLQSWLTQRDSPHAHRLASHARLALTPQRLRYRVDHHVMPANLLHKLARRLDVSIRMEGT
jgi:hypothetical protein